MTVGVLDDALPILKVVQPFPLVQVPVGERFFPL
jgi:hypothetical protein